jgi:hypothetical protein
MLRGAQWRLPGGSVLPSRRQIQRGLGSALSKGICTASSVLGYHCVSLQVQSRQSSRTSDHAASAAAPALLASYAAVQFLMLPAGEMGYSSNLPLLVLRSRGRLGITSLLWLDWWVIGGFPCRACAVRNLTVDTFSLPLLMAGPALAEEVAGLQPVERVEVVEATEVQVAVLPAGEAFPGLPFERVEWLQTYEGMNSAGSSITPNENACDTVEYTQTGTVAS